MYLQSGSVTVAKPISECFAFLSDVKNYRQLMPDNISKFEVIRDNAFLFALQGMPEIALEVGETTPHDKVVLRGLSDKLPFTLTADIAEADEKTSRVQFNFEGKFNPMVSMMVKKPLGKFLETLSDNLANI